MRQAIAIALLFFSVGAWATDIQCDRTQQLGQRVVCDYAILNHEYEDIYGQQQKLIQLGKLASNVLADWQRRRDACRDPHCMDGVFAAWSEIARSLQSPGVARAITASEAIGPASMTAPASAASAALAASAASAASQQASGVPVFHQGSAFGVALPQAVASDAAASAAASAAPATTKMTVDTTSSLTVVPITTLVVLAIVAMGAVLLFRKRRSKPMR